MHAPSSSEPGLRPSYAELRTREVSGIGISPATEEIAAESIATHPALSAEVEKNKAALSAAVFRASGRLGEQDWPDAIRDLARVELQRILGSLDSRPLQSLLSSDVRFKKDLALVELRRIPLGAAHADLSGIPRSWLASGTFRDTARNVAQVLLRFGGFAPLLALHVNSNALELFSPEGWDEAYRRAAELLVMHPEIRGIMCSSWWNDPALVNVSPRLCYLRDRYVENGGICLRVGGPEHDRKLALVRSETRRRLHLEGKYDPCVYLCAWPREDLLAWAGLGPKR